MSHTQRGIIIATVLFAASVCLDAQTAQITGRVTDPDNAMVVGCTVTVRSQETTITRSVTTNEEAYYTIAQLPAGSYEVIVNHPGFQTVRRSNVVLNNDQVLRLDIELRLGKVSDTIEISSAPPLLETESPTVSAVITSQKVNDLPLVGRNVLALATLVPGVRPVGSFGQLPTSSFDGSRASISGGSPSTNSYLVDGIASESFTSGGLIVNLSVDATEEFRIITRNPGAEYGRTGGGIINVISKSGTDRLHGDLYEFFRNKVLNANDFFSSAAGTPRSP